MFIICNYYWYDVFIIDNNFNIQVNIYLFYRFYDYFYILMKICIKYNLMIRIIFIKNTLFVYWLVDGDIEVVIYLKIIQYML